MSTQKTATICRPKGASSRWAPNLGADVLLLRTLLPNVLFAILGFIPPDGGNVEVEELDARALAKLVEQYNRVRLLLNATATADSADVEVAGIQVTQESWGYRIDHDEWVRMLIVPDLEDSTSMELPELRPEQVGCALEIKHS